MFFNSVKEINRLRKETNSLLIKGMSNIYLKVTIEKNYRFQNFDFVDSKKTDHHASFWGAPTHADIIEY